MKGDVVLIPFPFTDLSGNKLRPAVVLIETSLDLTVCFITTQLRWKEPTDVELIPSITSGVKKSSLIRLSKIATVDKRLALGIIGKLDSSELSELNVKLKAILLLS
ncbi:MAG: type II toxin-antitoxin system PemK/MazF family toxin [Chitinophagaceae bacterium]